MGKYKNCIINISIFLVMIYIIVIFKKNGENMNIQQASLPPVTLCSVSTRWYAIMSTAELCFLSSFFRKEQATFEKVFVSFVCDRGTGSYVRFLAPLPFTLIQIYTHEERKLLEEMKIVFLYFKHYKLNYIKWKSKIL